MLSFFTRLLAVEPIASFLAQYAAGKLLDRNIKAMKKEDSLEKQFSDVLSESLSKTCEHFNWEYSEQSAFENFAVSWNNIASLSRAVTASDVKTMLICTLGKETIGTNESEELYDYFLYAFYDTLCGEEYSKLHKFILIYQLNVLGRTGSDKGKPKTTKDIDVHQELIATYDQMLEEANIEKEGFNNLQEHVDFLSPREKVDFEDELNLLYYQSAPRSEMEETALPVYDSDNYKICGKYFSIYNPRYANTLIFRIDRKAIPFEHRYMYWATELDHSVEPLNDESVKHTYFAYRPADDGNHLIIVNINHRTGTVFANAGFLDYDHVKLSKKPTQIRGRRPDDFLKQEKISKENDERKEFAWSISSPRQFIIIDTEIGEEVKPEYRLEGNQVKASIWLVPYKKYITFEVRDTSECDCRMSDYAIGCAYRDGTYLLEQNSDLAKYYFRIAKAAGDARADDELKQLGLGYSG